MSRMAPVCVTAELAMVLPKAARLERAALVVGVMVLGATAVTVSTPSGLGGVAASGNGAGGGGTGSAAAGGAGDGARGTSAGGIPGGFRDPLGVGLDGDRGYGAYGSPYGGYGGYGSSKDLYGGKDFYDRGDLYGGYGYGSYGSYGGYGGYGGYGDRFGSGGQGGPSNEDDCARVEASGTPLAEALREAAENLGDVTLSKAPESVRKLVDTFAGERYQRFMLANCPQAVLLAVLLQVHDNGTAASGSEVQQAVVAGISDLLALAPTLRAPHRIPPKWTGQPWETLLSAAQQRTGIVLFPSGEQQFEVDFISPTDWLVLPRQRCRGRRDLGNLQATPLHRCLAKCAAHPLCRSATFWHWQPGGFGFEQRCFLSSTCTPELATGEGSEYAVLFAKKATQTHEVQAAMRRTMLTPGGAPWAPRCGHKLLITKRPGGQSGARLWLLGGVGVDPFVNASGSTTTTTVAPPQGAGAPPRPTGAAARAAARARKAARNGTASSTTSAGGNTNSVIEAYLSRHVELSGELPPLRSLPYGRLGDVWHSDDLGASWVQAAERTPWGRRTFFGAVAVRGGLAMVVFGGVNSPASSDGLRGVYKNDVWWADIGNASSASGSAVEWRKIPKAAWAARAGFQTVVVEQASGEEQLLLLGGRLADGILVNDVWETDVGALLSSPNSSWNQLVTAADWDPRADFATAAGGGAIWVLGGADKDGRALADVWRSDDGGRQWRRLYANAPWGPRVGPVAVRVAGGQLLLFGGYAYPDADFGRLAPAAPQDPNVSAAAWSSPTWVSTDGGSHWSPLNSSHVAWSPNTMHSSMIAGPCGEGADDLSEATSWSCVYTAGGLTHEGYYDNNAHRIATPALLATVADAGVRTEEQDAAAAFPTDLADVSRLPSGVPYALPAEMRPAALLTLLMSLPVLVVLCSSCCRCKAENHSASHDGDADAGMDPATRRAVTLLAGGCVVCASVAVYAAAEVVELSKELRKIREAESPECRVDSSPSALASLKDALGFGEFETLLRLASREAVLGYDGYGYGGSYKGFGRGYGDMGRDRGYGGYDSLFGGGYGGYGGYGGHGAEDPFGPLGVAESAESGKDAAAAQAARELASLPTTQSLSCRSPRCDRNASACSSSAPRSLTTPYGCCSDYMMLMLGDVTDWLEQQQIPYFITYGTLLGALREGDMLPWTQDMDIVVDRSHWPKLQRGLEAAEFFGGRRYLFGVDQWEERVSRVCADWEGFAASVIGGPDGDRFSRGTEFHLDIYASDWWQVKDLHLIDCVEPLASAAPLLIRGRNFSAPARPRACVEKLYGAEWRTPKKALSGVN